MTSGLMMSSFEGKLLLIINHDANHWVIRARVAGSETLRRLPFTYSDRGLAMVVKRYEHGSPPTLTQLASLAKTAARV